MSKSPMVNESHGVYYAAALKVLKPDSTYLQSLVVYDGQGNKTQFLTLNPDSIPVLIDFLQKEQKRLDKIKGAS